MNALLFAALAAVGAASPENTPAAQPNAPKAAAQPVAAANSKASDPEAVICQRVEVTGTRFPSTICQTRAQWKQMAEDSQDYVKRVYVVNPAAK